MFILRGCGFPPQSKTQILELNPVAAKCTDEDLDLIPHDCTEAAHCSSEEGGSNAGSKFHCCLYVTNKVSYLP